MRQLYIIAKAIKQLAFITPGLVAAIWVWYQYSNFFLALAVSAILDIAIFTIWSLGDEIEATDAQYDWHAFYKGNPVQRWWKRNLARIISTFSEGGNILDVGCGSSPLVTMLARNHYTGIDINLDKIKYMESKQLIRTDYKCMSIDQLLFNAQNGWGSKYNTVICSEVIEHFSAEGDVLPLIRALSRLVKQNGIVIIATPNYDSRIWRMVEKVYKIVMPQAYGEEHQTEFNEQKLVAMCEHTGLKHEATEMLIGADMVCKFRRTDAKIC